MKKTKLFFTILTFSFLAAIISCKGGGDFDDFSTGDYKKITSSSVSLSGVDDDSDIYMFVYNTGDTTKSWDEYYGIFNQGGSRSAISPVPTHFDSPVVFEDDEFAPYTCGLSLETVRNAMKNKSNINASRTIVGGPTYKRDEYKKESKVGDETDFWIQYTYDGETGFVSIPAVCRYVNEECQVFVEGSEEDLTKENYYDKTERINTFYIDDDKDKDSIKITQAGVKKIADKFTEIYYNEQELLGKANLDFIKDNSNIIETPKKITILVSNLGGTVLGYFNADDLRCDCNWKGEIDTNGDGKADFITNQRMMFTLNTYGFAQNNGEDVLISTLAHEFNHMLNYINKTLRHNVSFDDTWFTEMLSVTTEDYIYKHLEIKNTVQNARLRYFLRFPYSGMINWQGLGTSYSYGFAYAFGAYLVRNYGGADLINQLATSRYQGKDAITKALKECGYNETYESVLQKFGLVLVNANGRDKNIPTLNKSVTTKINNCVYSFPAVNIYDFSTALKNETYEKINESLANPNWTSSNFKGPCFYRPASPPANIYGGGFYASYLGKAGDYGSSLKFNPPNANGDLQAYLFISN